MRPLALTMGDPAGIGGELSLRAWQELRATGHHPLLKRCGQGLVEATATHTVAAFQHQHLAVGGHQRLLGFDLVHNGLLRFEGR